MNDSYISSVSESCSNCDKLKLENRQLRHKIAASLQPHSQISLLQNIKLELEAIQQLAKSLDIEVEDLAAAITFAFDKLFAIKSKAIVQKGKSVIGLIKQLFEQKQKSQRANRAAKVEQGSIDFKSERIKKEQKSYSEDDYTQKIENKRQIIKEESRNVIKTQKEAKSNILSERNSHEERETKAENPYYPRQPTPIQRKPYSNLDEEHQKMSMVKKSNYEDLSLPLIWEKRTFFDMSGKTITKKFNDIYKKICTETPLPRFGKHTIKMQMVANGTVAIGVVTETYKGEMMIDDRKCDAVKYLSFQNGGGLIKFAGQELMRGDKVHLAPGQVLEILYDAELPEITFKNPNLPKAFPIRLTERFKNKELYLFLEMKQLGTAVKMI